MTKQISTFSWHRVGQLYQYNAPWLKKQVAVYFLISLITALVFIFTKSELWRTCSMVLNLMFIWSPIIFTQTGDTRILDRLIPASPLEKFIFYMSYLLIVIPIACFLFPTIATNICPGIYGSDTQMTRGDTLMTIEYYEQNYLPKTYILIQYLTTFASMLTCFYFVIVGGRNGFVKAYLISILVLIVLSLLPVSFMAKNAFMAGYNEATGLSPAPTNEDIIAWFEPNVNVIETYMSLALCIVSIYVVFILWKSYRALYRINI